MRVCEMSVLGPTVAGERAPDAGALVAHPQQDVAEVIAVLRLSGLGCLAVVEDGVVVGAITEQDVVRALARDDADIRDDVRCRLARHRGLGRWTVTVRGGDVVLTGPTPDPVECIAVTAIAGSVVGVTGTRFTGHSPLKQGQFSAGA
ncbi:MAG: hypothetical protein JWR81_6886 [Pseudonocardia sp.]|nr:hypothetical protein [Pseudonocardia sp.]